MFICIYLYLCKKNDKSSQFGHNKRMSSVCNLHIYWLQSFPTDHKLFSPTNIIPNKMQKQKFQIHKYSATNTKQQVAVVMVMHVKPSLVANFNHSGQSWRAEENSPPALKLNQVATFCSCFRKRKLLLHLLKNNPNLSLQLESS